MKKNMFNGSYTVEAALIFPIIFYVILALIFMSFYLHDITRINGILNITAIKGEQLIKSEADIEKGCVNYDKLLKRRFFYNKDIKEKEALLKQYLNKKLKRGLFIADVKEISVSTNQHFIKLRVTADMKIPLISVKKYFVSGGTEINTYTKLPIHNPEEFVRAYDAMVEIGGQFKDKK